MKRHVERDKREDLFSTIIAEIFIYLKKSPENSKKKQIVKSYVDQTLQKCQRVHVR